MRNSWLAILVAAGMLAGCGGGSSGGAGSAQTQSGPTTYVAAKPATGDYYAFKYTSREQGANPESPTYITRLVSNVAMNGTVSIKYLGDHPSTSDPQVFGSGSYSADFDAQGRWIGSSNWRCGASSNPPMYVVAPLTLSVGMKWEYSGVASSKCTDEAAVQTTLAYKDAALAQEQVTVPAGTFNTIKVSRSSAEDNVKISYTAERTCWWEPDMGVEVKCLLNETAIDKSSGVKSSRTETRELQGYSNQKLGRKNDTLQRFAGNWTGRYTGRILGADDAGTCSFTFDLAGNVKGSCSGAALGFSVTGKVSVAGQLTLNIANNANWAVQGKMDSIEQASGTWEAPNYGSGTWIVKQD
jgi:hypothetical protein